MKNNFARALHALPDCMDVATMRYEIARKTRVSNVAVTMIGIVASVTFGMVSMHRHVYGI